MKKLTTRELAGLAHYHNWADAIYDNNDILVRSLSGEDDDWYPVTSKQLADFTRSQEAK